MGPVPPSVDAGKGPVTRCLDLLSVGPEARGHLTALKEAIAAIRGRECSGLEEVFARYLFPPFYKDDQISRITEYLRTNWFSATTGWWPSFQPIAPIYGEGLLQTLGASLSTVGTPLPIDSYWILGHGQVQLVSLRSPRQVTLLITTPTVPGMTPPGLPSETSEVCVTSRRAGQTEDEIDPITGESITGPPGLRVRTLKIPSRQRRMS